jgi:BirA family transcriptional regulator, biotin operon repressor / biotin---[acetyl-CoA-carboxylase] ligase
LKQKTLNLLNLLKDDGFVSGTELSHILGVSRATINNYIAELRHYRIDIYSVKGKGYKIHKLIKFLNVSQIGAAVKKLVPEFELEYLYYEHVIDSTNQFLLGDRESHGKIAFCLAEYQSSGRGRRGRTWQASFGADLTLSMKYPFNIPLQNLSGLSLAVGVSIANTIKKLYQIECQLKWPNDVYIKGKKVCGVLIEIIGDMHGSNNVVIGVGCNILTNKELDQPVTSISSETRFEVCRQDFTIELITSLIRVCQDFQKNGFRSFVAPWNQLDYLYDQPIEILSRASNVHGIGKGIDDKGGYRYMDSSKELKVVYGGEVSLRALN